MAVAPGHQFGDVVRQFRNDNDIKEQEFCANVGRSKSWLYYFERGEKGYYDRTAGAILRAYPAIRPRLQEAGVL